jgi:hypothetical protein
LQQQQQQQQELQDNDQMIVSGLAHHGWSAHINNPVGVVIPAYASANPQTTLPSPGEWTVVPFHHRHQQQDPARERGSSTPLPDLKYYDHDRSDVVYVGVYVGVTF